MIYYIKGTLVGKNPTQVIIETNGIAYQINVPLSTSENIGKIGSFVQLFTFLYFKEENLQLYGFAAEEEKTLFELLISVPGIGPKVALRILSGITPSELQQAVITQEVESLTKVPGIGKKTAERLLLELKEQVEKIPGLGESVKGRETEMFSDAIEVFVTLGYKRSRAVSGVKKILKQKREEKISLELLIKEVLKII